MCIELPGRVVALDPRRPEFARVDVAGVVKSVHIGMLGERPEVGDWLALHLGFAIERMTEEQATEALAYDELDPFAALVAEAEEAAADEPPAREGAA